MTGPIDFLLEAAYAYATGGGWSFLLAFFGGVIGLVAGLLLGGVEGVGGAVGGIVGALLGGWGGFTLGSWLDR